MNTFVDIHTHRQHPREGYMELVSLDITELCSKHRNDIDAVCEEIENIGRYVSLGIHPWNANHHLKYYCEAIHVVSKRCTNIVSIGEIGLDKMRDIDLQIQEDVFCRQIAISEALGLPVVIHCVRAYDALLRIRKSLKTQQKWIVHGFRGKPQLALQLLHSGMDISLGVHFHLDVPAIVPLEHLWIETDTASTPLQSVYTAVSNAKGIDIDCLANNVHQRFLHIFSRNNSFSDGKHQS